MKPLESEKDILSVAATLIDDADQWTSLINCRLQGHIAMMARFKVSLDSIAGGDGTSKINITAYSGLDGTEIETKKSIIPINDGISTETDKDVLDGAGPMTDSRYFYLTLGGLPFGNKLKIAVYNAGTAYTGGTITIDEITLFG